MKIAIIHDWLVTYAGAERVLEQMLKCYPEADLFSLVDFLPQKHREFILNKPVTTSFIQRLPWARKKYRSYLPFMPLAVEQFDLSAYDLILSSSHAVAKGVLTGPDQLHICYVNSVMGYAWDLQHSYLKQGGLDQGLKGWVARMILHYIRIWDSRSAHGVDVFVSNSKFVARRILKLYGRKSFVIYPPVDIECFSKDFSKDGFYVTAARFVPYKRIDLIVDAFSAMPSKKLIVIGDGPDLDKIKEKARDNIDVLGYFASKDVLSDYIKRSRAFVFAAEEYFGITILEAQACGTPVIALGKGGALETVVPLADADSDAREPRPTGVLFYEQTVAALVAAVERFEVEGSAITPEACRANAERFAPDRFRKEFTAFVDAQWQAFRSGGQSGEL